MAERVKDHRRNLWGGIMGIKLDKSLEVPQYSPVCSMCKHYQPEEGEGRTCKAFKDIPLEIWLGKDKHKKPFPGDHGIQFESVSDTGNE